MRLVLGAGAGDWGPCRVNFAACILCGRSDASSGPAPGPLKWDWEGRYGPGDSKGVLRRIYAHELCLVGLNLASFSLEAMVLQYTTPSLTRSGSGDADSGLCGFGQTGIARVFQQSLKRVLSFQTSQSYPRVRLCE